MDKLECDDIKISALPVVVCNEGSCQVAAMVRQVSEVNVQCSLAIRFHRGHLFDVLLNGHQLVTLHGTFMAARGEKWVLLCFL